MSENTKKAANIPMSECRPDYEKEYNRLIKENLEYFSEIAILRETIIGMCKSLYGKNDEQR